MSLKKRIAQELETLRQRKGGVLKAEDVVDFARDKDTALHTRFEWDDTEAAEKYRLQQAREVIRVCVTVLENGATMPQYVSLVEERLEGGGYRPLVDVLSDEQMRSALLLQAKKELYKLQRKYREVEELAEVFAAIRKVA